MDTSSNRTRSLMGLTLVCVAALCSGAAALSYEITWSRMLVIPLGNSADAMAVVLAAFMLGMAAGARLLGGMADRTEAPLKLYGLLESILGIYALSMPFVIHSIGEIRALSGSFETAPFAFLARYFVFCLVITVPSLAMGATLPVLTRAICSSLNDSKKKVGLVYGLNTIGAALGAIAAGFFAIPLLGMTSTSFFSVGFTFFAAALAFAANRMEHRSALSQSPLESRDSIKAGTDGLSPAVVRAIALIGAAVSGFVILGGEILQSRVLTFIFGHDTYAFSALLAFVLLGLGLGGLLYSKLAGRDLIVLLSALIGLESLAMLDSFWATAAITIEAGRDPFNLVTIEGLAESMWIELFRETLLTPILVLAPSIIAGAAFPAALALYAETVEKKGAGIGSAALVNGIAAALGAIAVPAFMISVLGIQGSFIALGILGAVSSVVILKLGGKLKSFKSIAIGSLPAVMTIAVALIMPAKMSGAMLREAAGSRYQRIAYFDEGRTGTVSVTVNTINQEKQLFMNAVNEVTTRLVHDQSFKLLGHLGPLLHKNPENGLMICFGAGISAGAALVHPLKKLDVIELSSAIPKAAHLWADENNNAIKDPRLTLHIDDGRHFLRNTKDLYDTITIDSTHPKASDSWILYTSEFYELVKSRLAKDGIAVQWLPLHGLSELEFKIIVHTFRNVFKNTTLFANVGYETYGPAAYVKMVGTLNPLVIDYQKLKKRLSDPKIKADLQPYGMDDPMEILDTYLAGPGSAMTWTEGLPVQTDDHPIVPYNTAFSKGRRMSAKLLLGVRSPVTSVLKNIGENDSAVRKDLENAMESQGFLLAGLLDDALRTTPNGKKLGLYLKVSKMGIGYYTELAKLYGDDPKKLTEIGNYLDNLGFAEQARDLYERSLAFRPRDTRTKINLALALLDLGKIESALSLLIEAASKTPNSALVNYNLGVIQIAANQLERAIDSLTRAIEIDPFLINARLSRANAYLMLDNLTRAEQDLTAITEQNRFVAEAWDMLGLVFAKRKDFLKAKSYHLKALSLDPVSADAYYNLGIALEELGEINDAAKAYEAALHINPNDAEALNNLGLVYAGQGLFESARDLHLKALDADPAYVEAAFNLGLDYKSLGDTQKAAEAFGMALEIAPNLAQAKDQLKSLGIDKVEIKLENDIGEK